MGYRAALLTGIALACAQAGGARAGEALTMTGAEALDAAATLVEQGRLDAADLILRTLATADEAHVDPLRRDTLAGVVAQARGDHLRAVGLLERVLDRAPDVAVARFHLAESLFALRRDRRAAYQYRLAAPRLPRALAKEAAARLREIDDRRVVSVRLRAAIVPDSNFNTATDKARQVIFGVEQTLNDDGALARGGVGLSASADVTLTPKVKGPWRAEARLTGRVQDQSNADFDYVQGGIELGPRWQGERVAASVLGIYRHDAYGGDALSDVFGARMRLNVPLARRTRTGADVSAVRTDHRRDGLDGWTYAGAVFAQRAIGGRAVVGGQASLARIDTDSPVQDAWRVGGGVFASKEVRGGITVTAAPSIFRREADETAPGHQARRVDTTLVASISATKRGLAVGGLAPLLSYTYTRNASSVGLFDYDRHRVDLGVTTQF